MAEVCLCKKFKENSGIMYHYVPGIKDNSGIMYHYVLGIKDKSGSMYHYVPGPGIKVCKR